MRPCTTTRKAWARRCKPFWVKRNSRGKTFGWVSLTSPSSPHPQLPLSSTHVLPALFRTDILAENLSHISKCSGGYWLCKHVTVIQATMQEVLCCWWCAFCSTRLWEGLRQPSIANAM